MTDRPERYFNTAATGLIPPEYIEKMQPFWQRLTTNASAANETWYSSNLPGLRQKAASFLGAEEDEIAFVPNFSFAINAIVQALPKDLRVLTLYEDYPSIADPFRLNGFSLKRLKSRQSVHFNATELQLSLIEDRIDVLAISHVQWLTGYQTDLNTLCAFCRENNILTIVDATQSMGALPLSLNHSGADVIIGSNYKWMNAGFGSGIMCVSKSFLQRFPARIRGNHSRMLAGDRWEDDTSILGYEPGHLNTPGLILLESALDDKLHTGTERIAAHNRKLTQRFIETLVDPKLLVGPESMRHRSSIVSLSGGEPLFEHLTAAGFTVSFRNGLVRISFHYHNSMEETEALVHAVNQFALR